MQGPGSLVCRALHSGTRFAFRTKVTLLKETTCPCADLLCGNVVPASGNDPHCCKMAEAEEQREQELSAGLLLPDAVEQIWREGRALKWDAEAGCYEVIDAELFESRFDALRRKRVRDDGSKGRPFSRMHKVRCGERASRHQI